MRVLSYVHHLFDVHQCHAYIHTLRWERSSLQCVPGARARTLLRKR